MSKRQAGAKWDAASIHFSNFLLEPYTPHGVLRASTFQGSAMPEDSDSAPCRALENASCEGIVET